MVSKKSIAVALLAIFFSDRATADYRVPDLDTYLKVVATNSPTLHKIQAQGELHPDELPRKMTDAILDSAIIYVQVAQLREDAKYVVASRACAQSFIDTALTSSRRVSIPLEKINSLNLEIAYIALEELDIDNDIQQKVAEAIKYYPMPEDSPNNPLAAIPVGLRALVSLEEIPFNKMLNGVQITITDKHQKLLKSVISTIRSNNNALLEQFKQQIDSAARLDGILPNIIKAEIDRIAELRDHFMNTGNIDFFVAIKSCRRVAYMQQEDSALRAASWIARLKAESIFGAIDGKNG